MEVETTYITISLLHVDTSIMKIGYVKIQCHGCLVIVKAQLTGVYGTSLRVQPEDKDVYLAINPTATVL